MKKFVCFSSNYIPKYQFYIPLVAWAWKQFGWTTILKTVNAPEQKMWLIRKYLPKDSIETVFEIESNYRSETFSQMSRLYAAASDRIEQESFIMTSDADMIPLANYWLPDESKINIWGHDLTSYQHMPICFIGMKKNYWLEVMKLDSNYEYQLIKRDIDLLPQAKSENKEQWWCCDQDLITERINSSSLSKVFHHRGIYPNGYPIGRVDRSAWSQNHETYIDCHAPHDILTNPESRLKLLQLLKFIWPNEDFTWWKEYQKEFLELLKTINQ